MAIIVEEEKRGSRSTVFITGMIIVLIIGLTFYYLFFKRPELIEVVAPADFQIIQQISQSSLTPELVTGNLVFNSLKQYVQPPVARNLGRSNPFLPF